MKTKKKKKEEEEESCLWGGAQAASGCCELEPSEMRASSQKQWRQRRGSRRGKKTRETA